MCGRYQFTQDAPELHQITEQLHAKGIEFKTGEIFPTNVAPVLAAQGQGIEPMAFGWGFPNFRNKGVIINARSESAHEKRMFKNPLMSQRCVIPTSGFFEWDKDKRKHLFQQPGSSVLYLAALYQEFAGESRYVILTRAANESMEGIHDCMPVILGKIDLVPWVFDAAQTFALMQRADMALVHAEVES